MHSEGGALAGLVGRCPAIESLRRELAQLGPDDMKVHVFGETGTGKERVARALHDLSPRRARPFVPVNGAGFTDDMLSAELFGHSRGAFTGAVTERTGYVAQAEGGTLFIDEVAELSGVGQARLLRFLQEGEYTRLGETNLRKANVRIISATNADLARRVEAGRFRQDLLYRLNDDTIVVPPLRERGEDVLLLARHFLAWEAARRRVEPAAALAPRPRRHSWRTRGPATCGSSRRRCGGWSCARPASTWSRRSCPARSRRRCHGPAGP